MSNSFSVCQGRDAARWWSAPALMWHPFSAALGPKTVTGTPSLSHSSQVRRNLLPLLQITQRERNEKTAGEKMNKGAKIREEEMGCFYSQRSHSLHLRPYCHHTRQNEGLISEKLFNTTCPQTVWRHAHKDESTHIYGGEAPIQGSRSRLQDQRSGETQIKTFAEPPLPLQQRETTGRNERRTMPGH